MRGRRRWWSSLAVVALFAGLVGVACERHNDDNTEKAEAEARSAEKTAPVSSEEPKPGGGGEADKEASPSTNSGDAPAKTPKSLEELPEDVNVLQHEMRVLNAAMKQTLGLIANNQLQAIPAQIKRVHPARQLTVEALEKGAYEPPKNAEKMDEFAKRDEEFHRDLKRLLKASKNDDLKGATKAYSDLVEGCTDCHTQFRF